ncbi:substrate-binding domain-containing protein, partial [Streptomyces sp. NPDC006386]|uniref:substrate-binding domain-containing protein n=1 Tax=Streptomyces sp. NPDC006386 TaxID=3156762 RepID=UPI0033AE87B2
SVSADAGGSCGSASNFTSQLTPQLTTVHVPYEEMGRVALRAVADRREGGAGRRKSADGDHLVLGTHVVVRNSVRPPAQHG